MTDHESHRMTGGACSACSVRSGWARAAEPCALKRAPKPRVWVSSETKRAKARARVAARRAAMTLEDRRAQDRKYQQAKRARDRAARDATE